MSKLKQILTSSRIRRTLFTGVTFIIGFVIFGVVGIQVWEWSNSPEFCTEVCHDVHPEEPAAYADSYHARVKCVECHMGRLGTIRNMMLKAGHFKHLPQTIFRQYEHPTEAETLRPANESCEQCHWPPSFHYDTVLEIQHFEPDEVNTETRTYLVLNTGGGTHDTGSGYGIHWHIENEVEYITTDKHKQDIPWVRVTFPDGRTVEYNDVTNPLSAEEIAAGEPRVMDCVDCHNQMGHPFESPEHLIDQAMVAGRLSTDLPFIKKEMEDLLTASYESQEAALEAVESLPFEYKAAYPAAAVANPEAVEQATKVAQELVLRLFFEEPGVTWRSFPNNNGHGGHKDFPGCFRCHDGEHLSPEGESVRLHCNICHAIPVVVGEDDRSPQMPLASVQEPESHLASNFIADHRFQANGDCVSCHGEVSFGSDDSSFCANSACHGHLWPSVDLDAAFPHPIPLENKHTEVWCHDCHEGIRRPEYACANCHEPPMASHFEGMCEDCHTTEGFEQAEMVESFVHPMSLEGAHATLDCLVCHGGGETLEYGCASCHRPPSEPHFGEVCEECHATTDFAGATIPPELHPVPLIGAHLHATCNICHDGETPEYVCSNCHRPPENHLEGRCDTCHTPEGWVDSADTLVTASPQIPHGLDGLEDCLVCHDPDGDMEPVPQSHKSADYMNEQCMLCHKPAP